jgi:sugar phosphate isomerase/epimerase
MLKYSFMTFACPEYTLDQAIGAAIRHGYSGVEPRAASGHRHGIETTCSTEDRAAIRRRFGDAGVDIACVATSVRFNRPSSSERREMIDETKAYIELAADVGAARVRVFGGHAEDDPPHDEAIRRTVDGLAACQAEAAAHEVMVCLETHDYFSKGTWVAAICREINSPWVQAVWDVQHPVTAGEDIAKTESALIPFVRHVHFHDTLRTDGTNEIVPIGEGSAPITRLLEILRRHGFEGYISGEWFYNHGVEKDLATFVEVLRGMEAKL